MAQTTPNPLGYFDLGLGGLGDTLTQQMKDQDAERKKKLLQAGQDKQQPGVRDVLGLNNINILGGNL